MNTTSAYEIPIIPSFKDWDKQIEDRKRKLQDLKNQASQVNVANSRTSSSAPPRLIKSYTGPNQRLDQAQQYRSWAHSFGNASQKADADYRLNQAQKAVSKLQPKSQHDLLMDALMTSRIGSGGKLYPLVGKLKAAGLTDPSQFAAQMGSLGMSAGTASKLAPMVAELATAALPVVAAAAVVLAAGAAVYGVAENTSGSIHPASNIYWGTGGSMAEASMVQAMGGTSDSVNAFSDSLRKGGYAAAYFRSKGIYDAGPFTPDKADEYIRGVKAIRSKDISDAQASWIANQSGMGDVVWQRDLNKDQQDALDNSIKTTPEQRKDEANYRYSKQMAGNSWDQAWRDIGTPIMNAASVGFNAADVMWKHSPAKYLGGAVGDAADYVKTKMGWGGSDGNDSENKSSLDKNTDAVKDLGRALKDHREMIGGGTRANGAIPAGWQIQAFTQNLDNLAQTFGAWQIG